MITALLARGLLVGLIAGLLAGGVGTLLGEPQVDRAIAFEEQSAPQAEPGTQEEEPLVSRPGRRGICSWPPACTGCPWAVCSR